MEKLQFDNIEKLKNAQHIANKEALEDKRGDGNKALAQSKKEPVAQAPSMKAEIV